MHNRPFILNLLRVFLLLSLGVVFFGFSAPDHGRFSWVDGVAPVFDGVTESFIEEESVGFAEPFSEGRYVLVGLPSVHGSSPDRCPHSRLFFSAFGWTVPLRI